MTSYLGNQNVTKSLTIKTNTYQDRLYLLLNSSNYLARCKIFRKIKITSYEELRTKCGMVRAAIYKINWICKVHKELVIIAFNPSVINTMIQPVGQIAAANKPCWSLRQQIFKMLVCKKCIQFLLQLRRSTTAPSLFGDTVEGGVGNFVEPIIKPSIWPVQKSWLLIAWLRCGLWFVSLTDTLLNKSSSGLFPSGKGEEAAEVI